MHHPIERIPHTMAFVTPVVEHWLEREIAQWVHHDGSIRRPIAKCGEISEFIVTEETQWILEKDRTPNERASDWHSHPRVILPPGTPPTGVFTPNKTPLTTIVTYLQKSYRSRISNHWATIPACSVLPPIYKQSKKTFTSFLLGFP